MTCTMWSESVENIVREMILSVTCIIAVATSTLTPARSLPTPPTTPCRTSHDRRVGRDAAMVEGRRHDAAMLPPGLALRGDEVLCRGPAREHAPNLRLLVVRRIVDQYMLDGCGSLTMKRRRPSKFLSRDVARRPPVRGVAIVFSRSARMNSKIESRLRRGAGPGNTGPTKELFRVVIRPI